MNIDKNKLAGLVKFDDVLDAQYGEAGTPCRRDFEARAKAWYLAERLKEERKRQKMTQKTLAERIGKKREYISALEKGQTDMKLSTFLEIAESLGLRLSLVSEL